MLTQEGNILLLGAISPAAELSAAAPSASAAISRAPTAPAAARHQIDHYTRIVADATDDGDGGKVVVWSDHDTQFYGTI